MLVMQAYCASHPSCSANSDICSFDHAMRMLIGSKYHASLHEVKRGGNKGLNLCEDSLGSKIKNFSVLICLGIWRRMLCYQAHKKKQEGKVCRWDSLEMRESIAEALLGDDWKPSMDTLEKSNHDIVDVFSIRLDDVANLRGEDAVTGCRGRRCFQVEVRRQNIGQRAHQ